MNMAVYNMYLNNKNKTATHSEADKKSVTAWGCFIYVYLILPGENKVTIKRLCDLNHTTGNILIMIFPYDEKGRIFTF